MLLAGTIGARARLHALPKMGEQPAAGAAGSAAELVHDVNQGNPQAKMKYVVRVNQQVRGPSSFDAGPV